MFTSISILFFLALLMIAALLEPLAKRLKLPFSIFLLVLGFVGSEFVTKILELDTGIRWHNFHIIIFHVLLPSLIFQAALTLDLKALKENISPVLVLALPGMLIGAFITAGAIYLAIDHPTGFPWIAALILGTLLSATDPAAVLSVLKGTNTPERLKNILEGESLFNDATSVVLFSVLVAVAVSSGDSGPNWISAMIQFAKVFLGGIFLGLFLGFIAHLFLRFSHSYVLHGTVTIITAYGGFIIAEDIFHISGVMAVLSAGLIVRKLDIDVQDDEVNGFTHQLWDLFAHISESLLFILAGVTITLGMFTSHWLAILFGVFAVIVSRTVIMTLVFSLLGLFKKENALSFKQQRFLIWGGVRGTVTIALALSIPVSLGYFYTIQSVAYGVVLFTLFFQATTIQLLSRRF